MSNVDAAPELLAAALSSAPPLVELVEVDVDELLELLEVCATEVTPGPVENAAELSLPQPSVTAATRTRQRVTLKG